MDTEICGEKGTLRLGTHTEVDVECGLEANEHGEYHQAGQTLSEGGDGAPNAVVTFRWRSPA